MSARNATGVTKYVFAGAQGGDEGFETKTCPRCGEVLFADMDICYGCLYDFSQARGETSAGEGPGQGRTQASVHGGMVLPMRVDASSKKRLPDPLDDIELDELDDDLDDFGDMGEDLLATTVAAPRHSKREDIPAGDTIDLSKAGLVEEPLRRGFRIIADSKDMRVRIPLTDRGLSVGRGASNDIVLKSSSVSRRHLRLVISGDEVIVEDCGATNPAIVRGKPLEGSTRLTAGDLVVVCGTTLELDEDPPDPAA